MKKQILAFLIMFCLLVPSSALAQKGRSRSSGGSVSVRSYTRKDGTHVSGYTRSAPGSRSHYSGSSRGSYNGSYTNSPGLQGSGVKPHGDDSWLYEGVKDNPMNQPNYSKAKVAPTSKESTPSYSGYISAEEQQELLRGASSTPPATEEKPEKAEEAKKPTKTIKGKRQPVSKK